MSAQPTPRYPDTVCTLDACSERLQALGDASAAQCLHNTRLDVEYALVQLRNAHRRLMEVDTAYAASELRTAIGSALDFNGVSR